MVTAKQPKIKSSALAERREIRLRKSIEPPIASQQISVLARPRISMSSAPARKRKPKVAGVGAAEPNGASARGIEETLSLDYILTLIHHAILPALAIVIGTMGFWALGMRGMMITTDGEDYLILAQAKGLRPRRIFFRYAVRNAILPQVTALALTLGGIVSGSILVEYIFAYPGMGYLLYQGIVTNDYALIQGIVFILILTTATAVLLIDLIYPFIDPRISYQQR